MSDSLSPADPTDAPSDQQGGVQWPRRARGKASARTTALISVSLVTTLQAIDPGINVVALPFAGREFQASADWIDFTRSLTPLVIAASMLGVGIIGDRLGRKRVMVLGTALVGLSALISAVAPGLIVLAISRVLMGLGTAMSFSMSVALVPTMYRKEELPRAYGTQLAIVSIAVVAATPLGGILVHEMGWRWSYLIVVILAGVFFLLSVLTAPESRNAAPSRLDIGGMVFAAIALTALVYGTTSAGRLGWTAPTVIISYAIAIIGLAVFARWELRAPHAGFPVRLFAIPAFCAAALVGVLFNFANGAFAGQMPLLLDAIGKPASVASIILAIFGVGMILGSLAAAQATSRYSVTPRTMFVSGLAILALGLASHVLLGVMDPMVVLCGAALLVGFGIMWSQNLEATVIFSSSPPELVGSVGSVKPAVGQVGMALGYAVVGPMLATIIGGSPTSADAYVSGYGEAMLWCAAVLLIGAGLIMVMMRNKVKE